MKDEKISKGNIIIMSFAVLVIIAVLIFAVLYKTSKPVISNNGIRIEGFEGEKTMQTLASSTECVLPTNVAGNGLIVTTAEPSMVAAQAEP